jgi:hypothetical protein
MAVDHNVDAALFEPLGKAGSAFTVAKRRKVQHGNLRLRFQRIQRAQRERKAVELA